MIRSVVGAAYGDEGKGKVVNDLATKDTLVVRTSGSSNCGHGVLHDGKWHVFNSLGSATMKGASTYFGPEFRLNPIMLLEEMARLKKTLGVDKLPQVYIHPDVEIVTPYDVFSNQLKERERGSHRHGSTGVGLGEAVARIENGVSFTFSDFSKGDFPIHTIRKYFPKPESSSDFFMLSESESRLWEDLDILRDTISIANADIITDYDDVIFEGNQGLFLDEFSDDFPHVTRARTGISDHVDLLLEANVDDPAVLHPYYLTRVYATRHGAGPFDEIEGIDLEDRTNKTNEFQGRFKYGLLDAERIIREVRRDSGDIKCSFVINHCDQADVFDVDPAFYRDLFKKELNLDEILLSYGPEKI